MARIYFQTHGCSTNLSESEVMTGLLKRAGFSIAGNAREADILVINICTVKGEATALREIRKLDESFPGKRLIIAGCITQNILEDAREIREDASFISTHNIRSIVEVVEEVINDNIIAAVGRDEYVKINLPKVRKNDVIGIVPILSGCLNSCSYCSVRNVKGRLLSYDIEDVRSEVMRCLRDGCREIWVTSQDNSAYMLDKGGESSLPELIGRITAINRRFFVRIGMMNPLHLKDILEPMIEAYKSDRVFKFLHVPVQSGNDSILRLMRRGYSADDFRMIIREFRKNIPNITISTDIICGFPTETEQQFNDSLNLIREIKPDVLNISRFQARPGTEAAVMEAQVDGGIIKNRSRLLTSIYENISRMGNERWLNWHGEVLIDEKGKEGTWIGRNLAYKPVIVKGNLKLGDFVDVRVDNITSHDLRGEII
ncbi:tRNA (N(6)-L-threonylcarbamoyladenosine(37)-C(2))-methylthiotransferase [Candidatus Woesearchaeota archaeon]|nr:tRNA (N(6)-L-threonylcarbamoyladenosine(37)-C(2))-methylthiotransferase [Candidatus Woesearchaeota archaeon]